MKDFITILYDCSRVPHLRAYLCSAILEMGLLNKLDGFLHKTEVPQSSFKVLASYHNKNKTVRKYIIETLLTIKSLTI